MRVHKIAAGFGASFRAKRVGFFRQSTSRRILCVCVCVCDGGEATCQREEMSDEEFGISMDGIFLVVGGGPVVTLLTFLAAITVTKSYRRWY